MRIYLSVGIEYVPDKGRGWRAVLTPFLRTLGHAIYDPAADVRKNLAEEEVRQFRQWKRTDPERFRATLRKIIAWDLDWVEPKCDCVGALWDEYVQRGAGSASEVTLAHRRHSGVLDSRHAGQGNQRLDFGLCVQSFSQR